MIEGILNQLRPEGVNLFISSKEYKDVAIKVEPIYGGRYIYENIPDDWRNSWIKCLPIPEFHLPSPNIFIAQDLSLLKGPNNRHGPTYRYPQKIRNDCWGELYFKQDKIFLQPRAMAVFKICSGKKIMSAHDHVCQCILETMSAYHRRCLTGHTSLLRMGCWTRQRWICHYWNSWIKRQASKIIENNYSSHFRRMRQVRRRHVWWATR